MPLPTNSQEGDPVLRQASVRATRRDVTFWHPGYRLMTIQYWEYLAKGAPSKDRGDWGDVYVDLSDNLLYAKTLRGWTLWPGVTSTQGASHGRVVSWNQLKKKWIVSNPTTPNQCLPDHSEHLRYLWCTREGIHWWTRAEIEDDMDKIHDTFPHDVKLRTNGRWIVRDFVNLSLQQSAPSGAANATQPAGANLKRARDGDNLGFASGSSQANVQSNAASISGTSASANKKQRIEDSRTANSGSLTTASNANAVQGLQTGLQAVSRGSNENAQTLKQSLDATQAELRKARADLAAQSIESVNRGRRILELEAELKTTRDVLQKWQQGWNAAHKRIGELELLQQQALQLLEGNF
ncbi:hypothetical protein CONPUDRAFT_166678 [Coniophora puteana RWD-64-598 SS2]|uniref:Uncharacterized protein n=1 Tax=Coniophora puteana (strain RWD-64-598) TaxID=741705 RepID=A0A5M3MM19_CONPW|nr:uncharacterized protein CONPUDRAFT_166678 [Coniophora puteana RWD-64-598 SS2]EIW80086.1 hypothetical protein CONPUDRAFT_166678 [Coniophora puteana RWD-64-598 SS2]